MEYKDEFNPTEEEGSETTNPSTEAPEAPSTAPAPEGGPVLVPSTE